MFHLLPAEHFATVEPIFDELARHHLFCAGVLRGKYPGRIFVDNPSQPRTALLVKDGSWAYLGGDADTAAFNQALHDGFFDKQITGKESGALFISAASQDWHETLKRIFPERPPVTMPRLHYVASADTFNGFSGAPAGFSLHFIDDTLREAASLPGDVQNVLDLRSKTDAPDRAAFGYVALQGETYAAHAVIDCIVGDKGDIGLFTADRFRRRGLAAAVSAAAIVYGLAHGLAEVYWDCAAFNAGSVRTAEKLGLQLTLEHTQYLIVQNENGHWINLVWNLIDAGQFQRALEACEQVMAQKADAPAAFHFLVGAAWAGLGDCDKALVSLNAAADGGWNGLADTQNSAPLAALHGTPEWEAVLARVRANAEANRA